jgi:hypothetical protein
MNRCDWVDCFQEGIFDGVDTLLLNAEGRKNISAFEVTLPSPCVDAETGNTTKMRATLCTRIAGGFVATEAGGCCVSAVNIWSVLSRMRMKREDLEIFSGSGRKELSRSKAYKKSLPK